MTVGAITAGRTSADALAWMQEQMADGRQMVFRGQARVYPTIIPSLCRGDTVSDEDRARWYSVLRRFVGNRAGLTGYDIRSEHDAVAIIQHYLVKSPVIDVTGTPEIALYFAMLNPAAEGPRVVYAADVETLRWDGKVVTDHGFLALPPQHGGAMHRWLRQDGYTVGPSEWTHYDEARRLDFQRLPGVTSFTFDMRPEDHRLVAHLGDLETTDGDPLAVKVRSMFSAIAYSLGCLDAVEAMMPARGTIDAKARLAYDIQLLIEKARLTDLSPTVIAEMDRMLPAARGHHWDTSWDAALSYWTGEVARAQQRVYGAATTPRKS